MKKILIVMLMLLSVFALSAENKTSDTVEVSFTLGNTPGAQKSFRAGFTSATTVDSLESEDPVNPGSIALTLAPGSFTATNNTLYIWWKNVGYTGVEIQLKCSGDLVSTSSGGIQWQVAKENDDEVVASSEDAEAKTFVYVPDTGVSYGTQNVVISTTEIPREATGTYKGTLTLSVTGIE